MSTSVEFNSAEFFRNNVPFFINRCEERVQHNMIFHTHDFIEICYVCAGSGFHTVEGKNYRVHKGDLFIINHDICHSFYREHPDDTLTTYNIMFKPQFLDLSLLEFNDFNNLTLSYLFKDVWSEDLTKADLRLDGDEQTEFDQMFADIFKEYMLEQQGYLNIIRAYLQTLIIKTMRSLTKRSTHDEMVDRKAAIIDSVIQHLRVNYAKNLNLNELAVKTFYSKSYLCRLFKETTGSTLSEYLQRFRVEEACKLLDAGNKKIVDIALEVGFSDYKSFYTTFKKIKGTSPSEHKR